MEAVVGDPEVRAVVRAQSEATGRPFDEVLRQAREYAEEIVPQYNARLHHHFAYRLARRIAKAAFRVRVGYLDDAILKDVSPEASVVFLINHRSNMDYVLVAFLTARYVAVSFAVGEWARVWPLEQLIRSLGGFFVRRNSHDTLYRKVLERYVHFAIERGVTQGVFLEGGLSKDGNLRPPKLGVLSYATKHFARDSPRDVVFVPVGVNYDRVLEDRNLLGAIDPHAPRRSMAQTAMGAARWVAKNLGLYARGRLHRFGYACVDFGAPISLRSYLRERGVDLSALEETARFNETERLGTLLMEKIAQVIPVTPVSLVASAILSFDGNEARRPALIGRVVALMEELESLGAHIYVPRRDPDYLLNVGLRMLTLRRLIVRNGDLYHVVPEERQVILYYANSIAHFFARGGDGGVAASESRVRAGRGRAAILVHGLARTARSMARVGERLQAAGYEVYNWDYPSRRFGVLALVDSLEAYVRDVTPQHERVDFVTHSMGGLLVRGVLSRQPPANLGHVVMLAPPNQGASIASRASEFSWVRKFFGRSLQEMSPTAPDNAVRELGVPPCPFGVIAGTRSFHPLQPTSYYSSLAHGTGSHDGTVHVDETRLPGMTDFITVNANHTFLMDHEETIRQTLAFLDRGRFDHDRARRAKLPD